MTKRMKRTPLVHGIMRDFCLVAGGNHSSLRATISTSGMGPYGHFAQQQIVGPDVRFWSKATLLMPDPMSAITPKATAIATGRTVALCH
jgi:hypothetical protein